MPGLLFVGFPSLSWTCDSAPADRPWELLLPGLVFSSENLSHPCPVILAQDALDLLYCILGIGT